LREVVWTDEAVANLDAIASYITAFNPAAAERPARRLVALADSLAEFPDRGRDAGDGRREISLIRPYILRCRVERERVLVLRIRHGAQQPD
jgi:plasmid stabilization system protein ParE